MIRRSTLFGGALALAIIAAPVEIASAQSAPSAQPAPGEHPALRLPRPAVSLIVERFLATCIDNAGDEAAQRAAGQRLGITWPFRLTVAERNGSSQCVLVSTIADGETTQSLGAVLEAALQRRGPARITYAESARVGVRLDGELTSAGRPFAFTGNVATSGAPMPTAVLILFNRPRSPQ
jgi:hypothetical protein